MSNLTTIKENIQQWTTIRNEKTAIDYLTSGSGFEISESDFSTLQRNNPEYINCYLAVNSSGTFKIYLVDNITDENRTYDPGKNLLEKDFMEFFNDLPQSRPINLNTNINPTEADSRITNWVLCANAWVNHKQSLRHEEASVESGEMVQVFTIPFSDLGELFSNENINALKATFALKYYDTETLKGYEIEIILAKTDFNNNPESEGITLVKETFADSSKPHPPYSIAPNQFNLLS